MKKTPTLLDLYEAIKPKYIIFCDMDGVLVDFDKGYEDMTGKHTKHVELQNSKDD
jgi:Fe-S-cluster formation regulator IscX/YfhJ